MLWWHWIVAGLVLAAAELISPGSFYLLFLGLAALAVGVLVVVGIPLPVWAQVVVFGALAVTALALFRARLAHRLLRRPAGADVSQAGEMVGEIAVPMEDIAVDGAGRVELRGTAWTARPDGEAVRKDQRCRVVRVEGLTLWISPE